MKIKIKFSKIFLLALILAVIVLLYFLHNIYTEAKDRTINQFQKQQKVLVNQSALAVKSYIEERVRALDILADFPASKKVEEKIFLTEYKRTYEKISGFIFIFFADVNGNMITGYPFNSVQKSNIFSDSTEFGNIDEIWENSKVKRKPMISKVHTCCDSVKVLFIISPVYDNNIFRGMIVGKLSVNDFIVNQVNPILSEYEGNVWILESDGELVYHSVHNNIKQLNLNKPGKKCFSCHKNFINEKKLLQQQNGNLIGTGRKSDQLTSFTSILLPSTDWRLAISIPQIRIDSVLKNLSWDFLMLGSLVFLLLISSVVLMFFQIRKVEKSEIEISFQREKIQLEKRYIDLVEKLPDGIFIYLNKKFIFFNNSLRKFSSHDSGLDFSFSNPKGKEIFFDNLQKIENNQSEREQFEVEIISADKKIFILFVILFRIEGNEEKAVHGIVRDITEIKKLEEEKKKKENLVLLGEMGARIAHEIKNPLASILTGIQLLKSKYKYSQSENDFFERIISEIRRMDNTVKSILHFAKNYEPNRVVTKIEEPLNEVIKVSSSILTEKEIKINLSVEPNLPPVRIDQELWKQIFWNLLNNSIQAINTNGEIYINIKQLNTGLLLEFGDSGSPIPAEIRHKVFQPFFSTKSQGTGLGLAITKRFIELHNAKITVADGNQTKIKFRIELPMKE
ncbi:MAG: sensor histidine kinase [Ignavibacteriales bacterium]